MLRVEGQPPDEGVTSPPQPGAPLPDASVHQPTPPAIIVERLTKLYDKVVAVSDISFVVPRGEFFGFLGPNGAGKSTTIRVLCGLLRATYQRILVAGHDLRTDPLGVKASIGVMLEEPVLYERLSAEDNLEFFGRIWHLPASERAARTKDLLTHLGLWDRRKETVRTWSRGMKRKLAIARALLHRPHLVFLDEPTSGLDPVAAAALRDDLLNLTASNGVTVFLTTHNLAEAEQICTQVGVIRAGELLAVGHPNQLQVSKNAHRVEIIGRGFEEEVLASLRMRREVIAAEVQNGCLVIQLALDADVAPLVNLIVSMGGQVEEIHKGKTRLEDTFLALMEEEE